MTKKVKPFTITMVLFALLVSCAVNPGLNRIESEQEKSIPLLSEEVSKNAAAAGPIKLLESSVTVTGYPAPYTMTTTLNGTIAVENIAYEKEVTVHIRMVGSYLGPETAENGWYDIPAGYSFTGTDGKEVWSFSVPSALYKGGQGSNPIFEYALRYVVNGNEYWDNNSGKNYHNQHLGREIELKSSTYSTSSHPSLYTVNHTLSGSILVENLDYNKEVIIRYIGNSGQWKDVPAVYSYRSYYYGNYEVWTFNITEEVFKYPPQGFFTFAIQYKVNGKEYWDNNNEQNYNGMVNN